MRSLEKQTARLRNFNSKSFCPSLLLMDLVYLADKPLLLKKKNKKKSKATASQEKKFPFPFWLPFICFTRRFTYSRDQQVRIRGLSAAPAASKPAPSSSPAPPTAPQLFTEQFQLLQHTSLPKGMAVSCSKGVTNHISEFQSGTWQRLQEKKEDSSPDRRRTLKIPITNHHNYFIISL